MEEREVTLELKDYLLDRNWQILSVHFPGAQGGLSISVNGRSRGWVPDIVAMKNKVVFTVESKSNYSLGDIRKLNRVFSDPRYLKKLKSRLHLPSEVVFQKAIAFHRFHFNKNDIPHGFAVFTVKGKSEVSFFLDADIDSSVKTVLQTK